MMLKYDDLVAAFRATGLESGDTLLVHSSYKSLGGVDGGPQTVIDALLSVLGTTGTLIMPTFNFDFCKGEPWDTRSTPSHMGAITNMFGKLRELDGKIMIVGLSYTNSMTFFHHVEEMEGVDYRYVKAFTGLVTDENGKTYEDTFTMLVRDVENGVITEVDPMGALMESAGIVSVHQIGAAMVKVMKANEVYQFTAREMRRDPKLLYRIDGQ
jgi:aminoglycoside 3-N-acetyltransferase